MPSHIKKKCPENKPIETPGPHLRLESMSIQNLNQPSSIPCASLAGHESNLENEKYCSIDSCQDSASCIKNIPEYCPHGIRNNIGCPGPCSQSDGPTNGILQANALSTISIENHNASKNTTYVRDSKKHEFQASKSLNKVSCCPDADCGADSHHSQDLICPSLRAYLDKRTSTTSRQLSTMSTQTSLDSQTCQVALEEHNMSDKKESCEASASARRGQNIGKAPSRKDDITQENGQCCLSKELEQEKQPHKENSCCKRFANKAATGLSQEEMKNTKLYDSSSAPNSATCSKCMSQVSESASPSAPSNIMKPRNVNHDAPNICCSMPVSNNEDKVCNCKYPPAFIQFGCTGNITGNCDCTKK